MLTSHFEVCPWLINPKWALGPLVVTVMLTFEQFERSPRVFVHLPGSAQGLEALLVLCGQDFHTRCELERSCQVAANAIAGKFSVQDR